LYDGVELAEAARRLYAMPLDQFMATRQELVAEARAAKDRDLASTVGALRKPSVAAWVVNQIVRLDPGALADLTAVGERLHEAQSTMDGAALRRLGGERTTAVDALLARASAIASDLGTPLSAAVVRDLHDTFTAAAMSADAAAAVTSGRMVRALSYAGFGDVDVSDAVAVPRDDLAGDAGAEGAAAGSGDDTADARAAERADAEAAIEARRTELEELGERQRAAEQAVNDLEESLERARAEVVDLVTERGRASRALRDAERALDRLAGGR
jgi:hypothetical protein